MEKMLNVITANVDGETYIYIPLSYFEHLVRAETELIILESVLAGDKSYQASDVAKAIYEARKKNISGYMYVQTVKDDADA